MKTGLDLPRDPSVTRILVVKWSAMGDVAIATALFEDIRNAFPDRHIDLNTLPAWSGLFAEDTRFDRVLAIDVRRRGHRVRSALRWLRTMARGRYDLVIDLQSSDRSRAMLALLTSLGRAGRFRVGINPGFPYTHHAAPFPRATHVLERSRSALETIGVQCCTPRPALHVGADARARATALMRTHGVEAGTGALLLPGSNPGGLLKRWGWGHFAELAWRLHQAGCARVLLAGGPADAEECAAIARRCGPWLVNLCGATGLGELVVIAGYARLVVANDTGPAHLVSANPTPMVVLCGPTDPRRVKPAGDNVTALQATVPCANCYRKLCAHHSCMAVLSPEMVMQHLLRRGLLPR